MNILFFRLNGKTNFIAVSPQIYQQIKIFTQITRLSFQEMIELVRNQFGNISRKSIIQYLQEWDKRKNCPYCYSVGKIENAENTKLISCPWCCKE